MVSSFWLSKFRPAARDEEDAVDDNVLVRHPQTTFLMRIAGDAMREVSIDAGDLVLIDRAIPPSHGHMVIAVVDDEFVCRQPMTESGFDRASAVLPANSTGSFLAIRSSQRRAAADP